MQFQSGIIVGGRIARGFADSLPARRGERERERDIEREGQLFRDA